MTRRKLIIDKFSLTQISGNFFKIVASNLDSKHAKFDIIIIQTAIVIIIAWHISILSSLISVECSHIFKNSIGKL